ncbi:MAG: hypothetical protein ACK5NT_09520 [Pyrinomonadaceae bacterium]
MIIAISSPPPIDKSELAEKLAAQFDLRIIENPVPALCKDVGFQTLYDMPYKLQIESREKLIREHAEFVKANDNLLLKFSVFEFLADWMRWAWSNISTEKWEEISAVAEEAINSYDKVYHLDEGKSLEYDGYVWFDKRNAKQINNLLKSLYTEMQISGKIK